ncbi:MAG: response regulator transcription factor [Clostridiaceae bacterium]|nr:response regulator transcription factor [Clostridiaceae bacterium]
MKIRIMVADGDEQTRDDLKKVLTLEGFEVDPVPDGITAIKHFRRYDYDLALLEDQLPELDGKSVSRQLRKMSGIPFIFLSRKNDEESILKGFELGAEDYITKPFSAKEVLARIKVILRRRTDKEDIPVRNLVFEGLNIDTMSHTVYVDGKRVFLTPKEYQLLLLLAKHPNQTFSREMILNEIWGHDYYGTDRTVDTHIKTLRDSLRPRDNYIETVRGFGYKFVEFYDEAAK